MNSGRLFFLLSHPPSLRPHSLIQCQPSPAVSDPSARSLSSGWRWDSSEDSFCWPSPSSPPPDRKQVSVPKLWEKKTETKENLFQSSPSVQEERILFHKTAEPGSEPFVFFIVSLNFWRRQFTICECLNCRFWTLSRQLDHQNKSKPQKCWIFDSLDFNFTLLYDRKSC